MSDERLFRVDENGATPIPATMLAELGFKEQQDLEAWVIEHPQILGDNIMIITSQFNRWQAATGGRPLDRLDVLGLDSDGRLVLAELKRDGAPKEVHLQAITYAAMVARFTAEQVAQELQRHLQDVTLEEAQAMIETHCQGPLDEELLRSPRIVLVAGDFSSVTITAVHWLSTQGLDIALQQTQAYRLPSGERIVTVSKLYPVPSVDDVLVTPSTIRVEKKREQREGNTVSRIIKEGLLADGTKLTFNVSMSSGDNRELIEDWLADNPGAASATWRNNPSQPLTWDCDGQSYKPTTIVKEIFMRATGDKPTVSAGPQWWITPDGQTLSQLVGYDGGAAFDWSGLHTLLEAIPPGRWTSYGDLAIVVGTAAQPLGQHIAACDDCQNAWRVLGAQGRSSTGFMWNGPTGQRDQQGVLEDEGVSFNGVGAADPAARLTAVDLGRLAKAAQRLTGNV